MHFGPEPVSPAEAARQRRRDIGDSPAGLDEYGYWGHPAPDKVNRRRTVPGKDYPVSTLTLVNGSTLDELGDTIGREKLDRLVSRFAIALADAFSGEGRAADDIGREAHTLVSMAGMLGCDALCSACRHLECSVQLGEDIVSPLAEARRLRDETLTVLTRRRGARARPGA